EHVLAVQLRETRPRQRQHQGRQQEAQGSASHVPSELHAAPDQPLPASCGSVVENGRDSSAIRASAAVRASPSSTKGWNGESGQVVIWIGTSSHATSPFLATSRRAIIESLSSGSLLPPNMKLPSE